MLDIMLLKKNAGFNFAAAQWNHAGVPELNPPYAIA